MTLDCRRRECWCDTCYEMYSALDSAVHACYVDMGDVERAVWLRVSGSMASTSWTDSINAAAGLLTLPRLGTESARAASWLHWQFLRLRFEYQQLAEVATGVLHSHLN